MLREFKTLLEGVSIASIAYMIVCGIQAYLVSNDPEIKSMFQALTGALVICTILSFGVSLLIGIHLRCFNKKGKVSE